MLPPDQVLTSVPKGLRTPLLLEFNEIVKNYFEGRWSPSELSGGRFCEIIYSILDGCASGSYPVKPQKPRDFVSACRALEQKKLTPRSFQILIPRMLLPLYEVRNNRGVGHAGGDVNPNHMDATAVLSMASWVMAEMVRVFHDIELSEAQLVVDSLVERRIPLIWQSGDMKRVLDPTFTLTEQILLLISSAPTKVKVEELIRWTEYKNQSRFKSTIRSLHRSRYLELSENEAFVQILPPGVKYIEGKIKQNIATSNDKPFKGKKGGRRR